MHWRGSGLRQSMKNRSLVAAHYQKTPGAHCSKGYKLQDATKGRSVDAGNTAPEKAKCKSGPGSGSGGAAQRLACASLHTSVSTTGPPTRHGPLCGTRMCIAKPCSIPAWSNVIYVRVSRRQQLHHFTAMTNQCPVHGTDFLISVTQQPSRSHRKTQRIWTWGGAPSSNSMSSAMRT